MLSKVVDGIWEIEIATAGNLLSTAIQKILWMAMI